VSSRFVLSATRIAEFVRFGCERQLRYDLVPPADRTAAIPQPAAARDAAALLRDAGRRWERRRLERLMRRAGEHRTAFAGWTPDGSAARLPYEELITLLRAPTPGLRLIVQPELRVPATLAPVAAALETRVELAIATPDALLVRRRPGGLELQVLDFKAAAAVSLAHRAQVAYYAIVLDAVCAVERLDGVAVDVQEGRLWGRDGRGPRGFRLAAYSRLVRRVLADAVPRVAATAPADCAWHVAPRCNGCSYLNHCRSEADAADSLARLPGLTPLGARVLREKGVATTAQLARLAWRKDVLTGCDSLERDATRLRQRAQALAFGKVFDVERNTSLMPRRDDVRLVVSAEYDPVTRRCFALGYHLDAGGAPRAAAFVAARPTHEAERDMLGRSLASLLADLASVASGRPGIVQAYVYDGAQPARLRALLDRHEPDDAVRSAVLRLLDVTGLTAPERAAAPAATVVIDVVETLFALPIPYAHDLAQVSGALVPRERPARFEPAPGHVDAFSSDVAFARAHDMWRRRRDSAKVAAGEQAIAGTLRGKLAAIDSVVRAVRERSERAQRLGAPRLPLATVDAVAPLPFAALERLRAGCLLEAAADAAATAALHALPPADRARRGESIGGMELVARGPDGTLTFAFPPALADAKFRAGDFMLLLSNDDGGPLVDEGAGGRWRQRARMVELVRYARGPDGDHLVVVAPGTGFGRAERDRWIDVERRCVLDRASVDFGTPRLLRTLRSLCADHPQAEFVRGLLDGHVADCWRPVAPPRDDTAEDVLAAAAARVGRPTLGEEQETVRRAVSAQPVTLIWGPPGTGKTHLLAWTVIGLAAAAARAGRHCRILVCASTHRAVANLLVRIAAERAAAGEDRPLRLAKLRGAGSESDAELAAAAVEVVPDAEGAALFDEPTSGAAPLVVGATVWSVWKQLRRAAEAERADAPLLRPWFDVVIVDEASQMKVAESLVALSALRPDGRLVLCGDDKQLAPVSRLRGTAGGPPASSVFTHFADAFPRAMLRESRRMSEPLLAYPRELFYPGLVSLCPTRSLACVREAPPLGEIDARLFDAFLDPRDAVVVCSYDGVRAGAANPFEAWLVATLARIARARLADGRGGEAFTARRFRDEALAVIAPHRAHNSAIRAALEREGFTEADAPVVDTVERMQGNERDAVIVSYGVADEELAEREAAFLLDPNRFNVAITRARAKLILLVSRAVLEAVSRDEAVMDAAGALQGYAEHCADAAATLTVTPPDGVAVTLRLAYRRLAGAPGEAPAVPEPPV
jgi:DNA replication ATP-dependent helicase Dna2